MSETACYIVWEAPYEGHRSQNGRERSPRYGVGFPCSETVFTLIDGVSTTKVPAAHMSQE